MTDRERQFAALGCEYAEGIDLANVVIVPSTGREIRKTQLGTWLAQPWCDNYWAEFDDLLDAMRFATRPKPQPKRTEMHLFRITRDGEQDLGPSDEEGLQWALAGPDGPVVGSRYAQYELREVEEA